MEEIKRSPLPKLECGMAYLAHPYAPLNRRAEIFVEAIKSDNVEEAGDIAYKIMSKYPNLTVLSPLHAYSFLEGKDMEETEILRGCMAEYGYAKARGIRIYEYVDETLYPLE